MYQIIEIEIFIQHSGIEEELHSNRVRIRSSSSVEPPVVNLLAADFEIEVFAERKAAAIGIDIQDPTVEELHQVIAIVLATAAGRVCSGESSPLGQANVPTIVLASGLKDVAAAVAQGLSKELGSSSDVEFRVFAVTAWGSGALLLGDLH